MPERIRTKDWVSNFVATLWLQAALKQKDSTGRPLFSQTPAAPIVRTLENRWSGLLGKQLPKLRQVQDIIKENKARFNTVLSQDNVEPLGDGWPKDADDIAYLMSLDKLTKKAGIAPSEATGWTKDEIDVALELKQILQSNPNTTSNGAVSDLLQHPYLNAKIPRELAIIKEIAIRRKLEQSSALGVEQVSYSDIYSLLMEWTSSRESAPESSRFKFSRTVWSPILLEPFGSHSATDMMEVLEDLLLKAEIYAGDCQPLEPLAVPDYDGQTFDEWYFGQFGDSPHGGDGDSGLTFDDYNEAHEIGPRDNFDDLLAAFYRTLETLNQIAPVDQLTDVTPVEEGLFKFFYPHPQRGWLEDSPLRTTWEWCLEAKTIARCILEHFVNLDVPAMENGSTCREMMESRSIEQMAALIQKLDGASLEVLGNRSHGAGGSFDDLVDDLARNESEPDDLAGGPWWWCESCQLWWRDQPKSKTETITIDPIQ